MSRYAPYGLMAFFHLALSAVNDLNQHIPAFLCFWVVLFALYAWALKTLPTGPSWRFLLFFALALRLLHLPAEPSLSDDIYRYLVEGRMIREGINPYIHTPAMMAAEWSFDPFVAKVNHATLPAIYPPLALYFFALAGALRYDILALKLALVLCDLVVGRLIGIALERRKRDPRWAALYLLNPLVIIEVANSGHFEPLGLLFIMLAVLALRKVKIPTAGLALGAAAAVKLIPAIALPALVRRHGWRAAWFFLALMLALYLPFLLEWRDLLTSAVDYRANWEFNPGAYAILEWITGSKTVPRLVGWLALAVLLAHAWRRRWTMTKALHAGLAVLLAFSPIIHPWYVMWLLPLAALTRGATWWFWSFTVGFSYWVFVIADRTGDWSLPPWLLALEYLPVAWALWVERDEKDALWAD